VHALKVAVRLFLAMAQVLHKRLVRLPELFRPRRQGDTRGQGLQAQAECSSVILADFHYVLGGGS